MDKLWTGRQTRHRQNRLVVSGGDVNWALVVHIAHCKGGYILLAAAAAAGGIAGVSRGSASADSRLYKPAGGRR